MDVYSLGTSQNVTALWFEKWYNKYHDFFH